MILKEWPLFIIQKPHEEITEVDVRKCFVQLGPGEKQQFMSIRDNASTTFMLMQHTFAENSFLLTGSPPTHGMFLLHSRFNHSCLPNAKVPEASGETIAIFATRDIVAGEEITFCYNTDFECRTKNERHRALRFVCDCKACLTGTLFQELSDLRRRLLRGLQYLTHGVDLDGKRQGSVSPIIVDTELRQAAENFSIPLSVRLVLWLLSMVLLEEEGLLDYLMIERLNPSILRMAGWFRTESNARVAKQAIAQDTWLGKFGMACRIYGLRDVADHEVAVILRVLQSRG